MSRPTSRSTSRQTTSRSVAPAATVAPQPPTSPEPQPEQDLTITSLPNLTPTQMKLLEKQQEHAGLQALKEASGNLLERVEELAKMGNVMADGGEAVGSVLRNWPHVFSILNLFDHPIPQPKPTSPSEDTSQSHLSEEDERAREEQLDRESKPLPQLVRLAFGGDEK